MRQSSAANPHLSRHRRRWLDDGWTRPLSGLDRNPPSEPTPGLGSNAVALVNVVQGEAGAPNEGYGITGEMTAIGHPALERFQTPLPRCHCSVGSEAVLEEVESASWTEHPSDLR